MTTNFNNSYFINGTEVYEFTTNINEASSTLPNMQNNYLGVAPYLLKIRDVALFMAKYFDPTAFSLGLIGNTLSAIVFYINSKHHTALFLGALAFSDLGQCALGLVYWYYVNWRQKLSKLQCQLLIYSLSVFVLTSTWTITIMTLEKYAAVRFPLSLRSSRTKKMLVRAMLVVFTVANLIAFPLIYAVFTNNGTTCNLFIEQTLFNYVYNWILTTFHFIIPFSVLVVFNLLIIRVIRRSRADVVGFDRRMSVSTVSSDHTDSTNVSMELAHNYDDMPVSAPSTTNLKRPRPTAKPGLNRTKSVSKKKTSETERQMTILFFTVTSSFFALWCLFHVRTIFFVFYGVNTVRIKVIHTFLLLFGRTLLFVNSAVNFYLYVAVSYKFRANLRHLFASLCRCR